MKPYLISVALLLFSLSVHAQNSDDTYIVGITGAPSIMLDYMRRPGELETHSFDFDNNLGTYYPDNDGVIRIELPKGYYQYIVNWKSYGPQNGSFYIVNRNVNFEINMLPPFCDIDTDKAYKKAYRCLHNKQKKEARKLFYDAAMAGNVNAMFDYARMCWNGMGGGKNKNHAYHFINEALKHGHSRAAYYIENFKDKYTWRWYL